MPANGSKRYTRPMRIRLRGVFCAAGLLLSLAGFSVLAGHSPGPDGPSTDEARARAIVSSHSCPCQCGAHLPGSDHSPACFGCSVGKAEVTFIRESIAAKRPVAEILLALRDTVLVEVFADYDDPNLPAIWAMARAAASAQQQHRVVLRTPAIHGDALRALEFAECARGTGHFSAWQASLIEHSGDWDFNTLVGLSKAQGLNQKTLETCLGSIDVSAQVRRDREHALQRGLSQFPAVTVNRKNVPIREDALGGAIRAVVQDAST